MTDPTHNRPPGGGRAQHPPLPPIDFAALAQALLFQAESLVPDWLPGGARRGHEWVCGSLSGEKGSSCCVNLHTGAWADFAGDERGGDLISLYAAINGLPMGQAALQLARMLGLESVANVQTAPPGSGGAPSPLSPPPRPPAPPAPPSPPVTPKPSDEEQWRTLMPVPPHAPSPTFRHYHRRSEDIVHTACYRLGGQVLGYVVRFRTSDGGKDTLPYTWCQSARDGGQKWVWRQWDQPRPLFVPAAALPGAEARTFQTVVIVEGEVKAEVLQACLDRAAPGVYVVVSWPGGSKAWQKALWEWLAGCNVLLWPDCDAKREALTKVERDSTVTRGQDGQDDVVDEAARLVLQQAKPFLPEHKQPGMAAMLGIGALLAGTHGCTVQMLPIPKPGDVVDGWDARDAIEVDGWDGARVLEFFGRAQALQAPPPDDAGKPSPKGQNEPTGASGGAGGHSGGGGGGGKNGAASAGAGEGGGGDGTLPWWLRPYFDRDKGKWHVSRKLVIAALTHDEALAGVAGLNQFSSNIDARRPWPWPHGEAGAIKGSTDLMVGKYLSDTYGLPSINRQALSEAIEVVAQQNPFHPVREWLQGLVHDGVTRVDKWLPHVLGDTPATIPALLFEYLSLVGRCWVLGMVHRVMEPGCKWDYCPVLEGPGGYRKSTLVEALASTPYFADTHFDVSRGKEGQEQVQGVLLYEIAELANFGKAEVALIKAFITAKVDRYRPSYGRTVESFPRQCVMVGTTNESTYLRDRSGNRRFWPVPVRRPINTEWVTKYRDQLFAEAYAMYVAGASHVPTREQEARLMQPMQESRLAETAVVSELLRVLTRDPENGIAGQAVNNLATFLTIAQIAHALGVDAAKSSPALEREIRSYLEHEGWRRVKRAVKGTRAWGYERPLNWPPKPEAERAAPDEDVGAVPQAGASGAAGSPGAGHVAPDDQSIEGSSQESDQRPGANPWADPYGGADDAPF